MRVDVAFTPVEAVCLYKDLSEVERAFANLKDVIEMRPIHHQTDDRVKAHIQVAALAFLLHRALEKKLKAARLDISATAAWQALRSVRLVEIDLGDGSTKRSVTHATFIVERTFDIITAIRAEGVTDEGAGSHPLDQEAESAVCASRRRRSSSAARASVNSSSSPASLKALGITELHPPTPSKETSLIT